MSENRPDEVYAQLEIFSKHLTPTQLDSIIGIKCDRSWLMGDLRKGTILREKQNGWILSSGLPPSPLLRDHVDALVTRISPFVNNFKPLINDVDIWIQFACIVYMYSDPAHGLHFDKATISMLHEIGACLDVDVYNFVRLE